MKGCCVRILPTAPKREQSHAEEIANSISHLFVIAGAACHHFAVLWYAA